MKSIYKFSMIFCVCTTLLLQFHSLHGQLKKVTITHQGQSVEVVDEELVVIFKKGINKASVFNAIQDKGYSTLKDLDDMDMALIRIPSSKPINTAIQEIRTHPDVHYAGPNLIMKIAITPNDSLFTEQEYTFNQIKCPLAWNITTGNSKCDRGRPRHRDSFDYRRININPSGPEKLKQNHSWK